MLFIAENLRNHRKGKDMTQEDVAEILGVSPQSVSKWERGDTYPDITFLPSLANLFKTSIDALIGMDKLNDAEARTAVFMDGQRLLIDGDRNGAATIYGEALKTYPNDESIMLELALVLSLDNEPSKLQQAVSLFERLLSSNPSEHVQYTARAALCYIFLKIGEKEKANNAAQKLPHSRICREAVLDFIEKEPSTDEINDFLTKINFREDAALDILVIDFGLQMLPMVKEHNLLEKIGRLRKSTMKGAAGGLVLPAIRVRDNIELSPDQVRVRFYANYILDRCFAEPGEAANEVISTLKSIAKGKSGSSRHEHQQ